MKYRIKTDQNRVKTPSDRPRGPRTGPRAPSGVRAPTGLRAQPPPPPPGPFRALDWPGTPRDTAWSSEPVFDRASAGWYRIGFHP